MTPDWSVAISQLNQVRIFDYFKNRSMPVFVEPLVKELVNYFAVRSQDQRNELLSAMKPGTCTVLGWYARKLAGQAVRENSRDDLQNGIIAIAISANKEDFRDLMAVSALLHNSALLLHEDPKLLFEIAAKMSSQRVQELFETFLRRSPDQKSIGSFGFSEGIGPHGFDYIPLLPEFGGPTPIQYKLTEQK